MNRLRILAIAILCLWTGTIAIAQTDHGIAGDEKRADAIRAAAAENLLISEWTCERIQEDLDEVMQRPDVDPSVVRDYLIYLDTVRGMVDGHQAIVAQMSAVGDVPSATPADVPWPHVRQVEYEPGIAHTPGELALLEKQLDDALEHFDQFILDEQYKAARRLENLGEASSEELTELAREAAAAVERLREKGIDVNTTGPQGSEGEGDQEHPGSTPGEAGEGDESGQCSGQSGDSNSGPAGSPGQPGETGSPGSPGSSEEMQGEEGAEPGGGDSEEGDAGTGTKEGGTQSGGDSAGGGSGSGASGTGEPGAPPTGPPGAAGGSDEDPTPTGDRPPADDDDIVARQLREAAEKETDPVLKEKLWQEYERYKGISE